MHWYQAPNGKRRLWIEDREFDHIIEQELQRASLYPSPDQPSVDIERFIQRHQKAALDQHADLGEGVAGAIEFWPDRFKISINRRLTERVDEIDCEPGIRGRWRATMAHESAHGLFHREIFQANPAQCSLAEMLFDGPTNACQSIRCQEQEVAFGGGLDWREFQANRGMAALLMPRTVFITVVRKQAHDITSRRGPILPQTQEFATLVRRVSLLFEVSRQAASIRLRETDDALSLGQPRLVANVAQ